MSDIYFPQSRVVGGGHTLLYWDGQPLGLLDSANDGGQAPQGQAYQAIMGVGDNHIREFVTQPVLAEGRLDLTFREVWHAEVWHRLGATVSNDSLTIGSNGTLNREQPANDLLDIQQVFRAQNAFYQRNQGAGVQVMKLIYPPDSNTPIRGKIYKGVTIIGVDDGDRVEVAGLSITKGVQVVYSHTLPINPNQSAVGGTSLVRQDSQFNRR